jgi:hypothetical protein
MNKKSLEIAISIGSVAFFIILIAASKFMMGSAGLKLAEVPDK